MTIFSARNVSRSCGHTYPKSKFAALLISSQLLLSAANAEDIPVAWTDDTPPSCCYNILRGTKADGSDLANVGQTKGIVSSWLDLNRPVGKWCYAVRRVTSTGEEKDASGAFLTSNVRCKDVAAKAVILTAP